MDRRTILRALRRGALVVLGAIVLTLLTVKLRYGRGTSYRDVSGQPLVAAADVTAVVDMDLPPGNVTGSRDGRISDCRIEAGSTIWSNQWTNTPTRST